MACHTIACGMTAIAMLLQTPAAAQSHASQSSMGLEWRRESAWLSTARTTPDGRYGVRIITTDLELATADGQRALHRRVAGGIKQACWILSFDLDGPKQADCSQSLRWKFRPAVASAIAMARSGKRTAFLELGLPPHS